MTGAFQRIVSTAAKREHIVNEIASQASSGPLGRGGTRNLSISVISASPASRAHQIARHLRLGSRSWGRLDPVGSRMASWGLVRIDSEVHRSRLTQLAFRRYGRLVYPGDAVQSFLTEIVSGPQGLGGMPVSAVYGRITPRCQLCVYSLHNEVLEGRGFQIQKRG
jgi:hypothetical protein